MKHQIGMSDPDKTAPENDYTEVRVRLPNRIIQKFEVLQKEWGLQSKGSVLERLLEEIFPEA